MKITLHYDFDEDTLERESIHVKYKDYEYEVDLKKNEIDMPISELFEKYHDSALRNAAYIIRCRELLTDGHNYF